MVKLTSNEEKVRKVLEKFPNGIKAKFLITECSMSKTPIYYALNRLETIGLAFRGDHNSWYPKSPLEKDSSKTQKKGLGISDYFNKRAERKKLEAEERRLSACTKMDLIADMYPDTMSDLKDVSKRFRKEIEEARKARRKIFRDEDDS
ncbi:MAG: hypothetical protein ACXACA_02810 [Candidatus Ranarchaeia archaeon]|jgi:hypothetical protein